MPPGKDASLRDSLEWLTTGSLDKPLSPLPDTPSHLPLFTPSAASNAPNKENLQPGKPLEQDLEPQQQQKRQRMHTRSQGVTPQKAVGGVKCEDSAQEGWGALARELGLEEGEDELGCSATPVSVSLVSGRGVMQSQQQEPSMFELTPMMQPQSQPQQSQQQHGSEGAGDQTLLTTDPSSHTQPQQQPPTPSTPACTQPSDDLSHAFLQHTNPLAALLSPTTPGMYCAPATPDLRLSPGVAADHAEAVDTPTFAHSSADHNAATPTFAQSTHHISAAATPILSKAGHISAAATPPTNTNNNNSTTAATTSLSWNVLFEGDSCAPTPMPARPGQQHQQQALALASTPLQQQQSNGEHSTPQQQQDRLTTLQQSNGEHNTPAQPTPLSVQPPASSTSSAAASHSLSPSFATKFLCGESSEESVGGGGDKSLADLEADLRADLEGRVGAMSEKPVSEKMGERPAAEEGTGVVDSEVNEQQKSQTERVEVSEQQEEQIESPSVHEVQAAQEEGTLDQDGQKWSDAQAALLVEVSHAASQPAAVEAATAVSEAEGEDECTAEGAASPPVTDSPEAADDDECPAAPTSLTQDSQAEQGAATPPSQPHTPHTLPAMDATTPTDADTTDLPGHSTTEHSAALPATSLTPAPAAETPQFPESELHSPEPQRCANQAAEGSALLVLGARVAQLQRANEVCVFVWVTNKFVFCCCALCPEPASYYVCLAM